MSRGLVIINSGAYIPQELSAEFGALPPAFLPVGLRRLYDLQIDAFGPVDADLHLTLPESMAVPSHDARRLGERGVSVIRTPDALDLGSALLHALAGIGFKDRPLRILHGDTLISGLDLALDDGVSVAEYADGYRWATVTVEQGRVVRVSAPDLVERAGTDLRLAGYFAFSSAAKFAEALALSGGDFFRALNLYAREVGLAPMPAPGWLDFGHVQTFFRSRRVVTTARAFNTLEISETRVRKRSDDPAKLRAEAHWLRRVPSEMKPYTARLLHEGEDARGYFYDTEYEHTPTLAELSVFGRLTEASWDQILSSCKVFLDLTTACATASDAQPTPAQDAIGGLVMRKTRQRIDDYARATGFDLDAPNTLNGAPAPSVNACLERLGQVIERDFARPSIMHGDFCFSNILYNFRTERIRTIDPRGLLDDGLVGLHGDVRYDAAKLMHSIVGRYDFILAGRCAAAQPRPNAFELAFPADDDRDWLERAAAPLTMGGVTLGSDAVRATTVSLFLSMLPLHADRPERQTAFIANALRLFLQAGA